MLHFLWHRRGSVPLNEIAGDLALDRIGRLLEKQGRTAIRSEADRVTFHAPLWTKPSGGNWRAMAMFDRGSFWIDRDGAIPVLRYDLRSLHGFVFCLFAAISFAVVGSLESIATGLTIGALAFCWFYGGNYIAAAARVPPLIRNAVAESRSAADQGGAR